MARIRLALAACSAGVAVCACSAWADEPKADIQGVKDRRLRQTIDQYIGRSKRAPQSRVDARRRAEEAAQDAIVVLRSEGYYDYQIKPDVSEGDKPRPLVTIEPGPRFTISDAEISWANQAPDAASAAQAKAALQLKAGSPGTAAQVLAAEGRIVSALKKAGYADAEAQPREVVVDHADQTVRPTYRVDAKARVRFDGIQVKTTGRTRPGWVTRLAPWKSGQYYDPDAVAELEQRLIDTGVFSQATVALAPDNNADGLRPVVVSLADRAKGTVAVSGSYSSSEGIGVNGRYSLYNRLGRADTESFSAQYSNLKKVALDLSLPHWRQSLRTLRIGASVYRDDTDAFEENDAGVHAELERRFSKTSYRIIGLSLDASRNYEKTLINNQLVGVRRDLAIATGLARWVVDRSDNALDPTHGWRFDGRLEPTFATGDSTLAYVKVQGQLSAYLPLGAGGRTVVAVRGRLGSLLSAQGVLDLPASRRFYAGGGDSVRGYGYQAVGPRYPDNTPVGGQSLVEWSAELRQKFNSNMGVVAFVDSGTVSEEKYPDFKNFSVGAGLGLRYDAGFGPLGLDVGVPLNRRSGDSPFQVYLTIGQSF